MEKIFSIPMLAVALVLILAACGNVTRLDRDEVVDYSGYWNDTDSRLVAEEMSRDALNRPWIRDYVVANNKKPTVIVGNMRNRSDEHIDMQHFVLEVERSLINSGKVSFVADVNDRLDLRAERADQAENALADTRNAARAEKGADFMMIGDLGTIVDPDGKGQLRYYQVNMQMVSLKDNTVVWVGQKEIKKDIDDARVRN